MNCQPSLYGPRLGTLPVVPYFPCAHLIKYGSKHYLGHYIVYMQKGGDRMRDCSRNLITGLQKVISVY